MQSFAMVTEDSHFGYSSKDACSLHSNFGLETVISNFVNSKVIVATITTAKFESMHSYLEKLTMNYYCC